MNEPRENSKPAGGVEHDAAAWVVKHARGLSDREQDEFLQWLSADPINRECFARQRHSWRLLDQLADWRPEHGARPNPDLLAPTRLRGSWRHAAWVSLTAAAILLGAFLGWRATTSPISVAATVEHRLLHDGSAVQLNAGAAIRVDYSAQTRRVTLLHGEAHFTVIKDSARPFVVQAGAVGVEAVGTAFNVSLDPDEVKVLVTEGRVRVAADASVGGGEVPAVVPVVHAGHLVVVPLDSPSNPLRIVPVSALQIQHLLAWQPQMLDFTETALPGIVAEFNRRNRTQIVLVDPELGALRLTVSFRSDNVEGFVRLLEGAFEIRAERKQNVIALRRAQ